MKFETEKEKKLDLALTKLKNLSIKNPKLKDNVENLNKQKNQLKIEKEEIEHKYKSLLNDFNVLTDKFDKIQKQKEHENQKEKEFSEKIDELNQETDTLLDEIDKWQM